jgi:transposase InsO family protein
LRLEIESIYKTFPELRQSGSAAAPIPASRNRPSREDVSAAARRKIALAQKKRWAEWRKKRERTCNCYDNAVMESFFSTVTRELPEHFATNGEAKMELFDYIEVFYNQRRRHSSLGQISPATFERHACHHSPWRTLAE